MGMPKVWMSLLERSLVSYDELEVLQMMAELSVILQLAPDKLDIMVEEWIRLLEQNLERAGSSNRDMHWNID